MLARLGRPGLPRSVKSAAGALPGTSSAAERSLHPRQIDLPADLFNHASPCELERCRRRVAVEAPHELRRHPDAARSAWLAAFVYLRARSLTDDLVDLLIETIHRIGARAETQGRT